MRFRVPVHYQETVIPPKSRKERYVDFLEWIEVDVEEVDPLEVPVAVEWTTGPYSNTSVDGVEQRRWDSRRFYQPAVYSVARESNVHIDSGMLTKACANGSTYSNPLVSGVDWRIADAIRERIGGIVPGEYRMVLTDNRTKAIDSAIRASGEVIIVDGKVWTACPEPVCRLRSGWFGAEHHVSTEFIDVEEAAGKPFDCFRVDRFEDMSDFAEARYGARPTGELRPRVFIPEALSFDDETPAFLAALAAEVDWTKKNIADHTRPVVEAWLNLRDAVVTVMEGGAAPDTAVPVVQAWIDALETADRKSQWAGPALSRWMTRPIEFGTGGVRP